MHSKKRAKSAFSFLLFALILASCSRESVTVIEPQSEALLFVGIKQTEYIFIFENGKIASLTARFTYTSKDTAKEKFDSLESSDVSISNNIIEYKMDYSEYKDMTSEDIRATFKALGYTVK